MSIVRYLTVRLLVKGTVRCWHGQNIHVIGCCCGGKDHRGKAPSFVAHICTLPTISNGEWNRNAKANVLGKGVEGARKLIIRCSKRNVKKKELWEDVRYKTSFLSIF